MQTAIQVLKIANQTQPDPTANSSTTSFFYVLVKQLILQ
jgi:hypothetical protein